MLLESQAGGARLLGTTRGCADRKANIAALPMAGCDLRQPWPWAESGTGSGSRMEEAHCAGAAADLDSADLPSIPPSSSPLTRWAPVIACISQVTAGFDWRSALAQSFKTTTKKKNMKVPGAKGSWKLLSHTFEVGSAGLCMPLMWFTSEMKPSNT